MDAIPAIALSGGGDAFVRRPNMQTAQSPLTILVVEDEADSAALLTEVLVEAGHRVIGPCGSAATAAILVAQTGPDIAFVDVGLEGEVDGVELARRLRANWGVPSIYATGRSDHEALQGDVMPFVLRKPYGEAEVLDALRRGADVLHSPSIAAI